MYTRISLFVCCLLLPFVSCSLSSSSSSSSSDFDPSHSFLSGASAPMPHWSTMRTHPEFVRLPMQRRNFPTQAARQMVGTSEVILPPKMSHGPAMRRRQQEEKDADGHAITKHTSKASTSTTNGSPLTGCASLDFTIPIAFGSTTTTYDLLFDTGSSTLAIAGSSCTTCTSAGVTKLYSNTGTATSYTASGSYGDGSGWSGKVYTDTVTVNGATGTVTPAVSMNFASMTTQTNDFFSKSSCTATTSTTSHTQGIIGFGYQSLALSNTHSFPARLYSLNPSLEKSFYVEMCLLDGALWFSGMSLANYGGQFYYVPITEEAYYRVSVSTINVDGVAYGGTIASATESIVDSGTTMWSMPTTQFNAVSAQINKNTKFVSWFTTSFWTDGLCHSKPSGYTIAQMNAALPTIGVTFGNGVVIAMKAVGTYILPCDSSLTTFAAGIYDSGDASMIMGWTFMNPLVIHHDMANKKIGFAVQFGCQPQMDTSISGGGSGATITGTTASGPTGTSGVTATETFTITPAATSVYTATSLVVTVKPSSAPASSVSLGISCTGTGLASTFTSTLTFTTSTASTFTLTSGSVTGSITCAYTLSGTNALSFIQPSSTSLSVVAYNTIQLNAASAVCIGTTFPITISTLSLTGALNLLLTQASSANASIAVQLTSAAPSVTVSLLVNVTGSMTFGLELGSAGGVDSSRFNLSLSTLVVTAQDCSINPLPGTGASTGASSGSTVTNDGVYVVLTFSGLTSTEFSASSEATFLTTLAAELVSALSIDVSQLQHMRVVYDDDGSTLASVTFVLAPASSSTSSTTALSLSATLKTQVSNSTSALRSSPLGSKIANVDAVECNLASTCADLAGTSSGSDGVLWGLQLWAILVIFIAGGLCILSCLLYLCCRDKKKQKNPPPGSTSKQRSFESNYPAASPGPVSPPVYQAANTPPPRTNMAQHMAPPPTRAAPPAYTPAPRDPYADQPPRPMPKRTNPNAFTQPAHAQPMPAPVQPTTWGYVDVPSNSYGESTEMTRFSPGRGGPPPAQVDTRYAYIPESDDHGRRSPYNAPPPTGSVAPPVRPVGGAGPRPNSTKNSRFRIMYDSNGQPRAARQAPSPTNV